MTVEEQAAMYEAGFEEVSRMDKEHLKRVLAQGTQDHMALEVLFSAEDDEKSLKVLSELVERYGNISSSASSDDDWFGVLDADMPYYWYRTTRQFETQRPLIHNGRKMRKNGN